MVTDIHFVSKHSYQTHLVPLHMQMSGLELYDFLKSGGLAKALRLEGAF